MMLGAAGASNVDLGQIWPRYTRRASGTHALSFAFIFSSTGSVHMTPFLTLFTLQLVFVVSEGILVHYHGYSVLRYELASTNQTQFIKELAGIDVWSHGGNPVIGLNDILVNVEQKKILEDHNIIHKVLIECT